MKFRQLLEKFLTADNIRTLTGQDIYTEVFENPNRRELDDILRSSGSYPSVRLGVDDIKNPVIYAWRGDVIHSTMYKRGLVKFKYGFIFNGKNLIWHDADLYPSQNWEKVKHQKEILKAIKRVFPRQKEIRSSKDNSITTVSLENL